MIVEDGTVVAGAESYLSVADADAYHTARGNAAWAAVVDVPTKEAALRKATDYLTQRYRTRWRGKRVSEDQALDWPRSGVPEADVNELPPELKHATAELALLALSDDLSPALARGGRVKRRKVGPIETEFEDGATGRTLFPAVEGFLEPFLRVGRLVRV